MWFAIFDIKTFWFLFTTLFSNDYLFKLHTTLIWVSHLVFRTRSLKCHFESQGQYLVDCHSNDLSISKMPRSVSIQNCFTIISLTIIL